MSYLEMTGWYPLSPPSGLPVIKLTDARPGLICLSFARRSPNMLTNGKDQRLSA